MLRRTVCFSLLLVAFVTPPAFAQDQSSIPVQALLVIAAVQTVILLVIAGFSIWQSHRTYLDTVRLHQMVMETQQNFVGGLLQSAVGGTGTKPAVATPTPTAAAPSPPVPTPELTRPRQTQPRPKDTLPRESSGGAAEFLERNGGSKNPIRGLSDVEIAILDKLVQDPAFFERHRPEEFGATQQTISSLLSRRLINMDGLKRLNVPDEVRAVLKLWTSGT